MLVFGEGGQCSFSFTQINRFRFSGLARCGFLQWTSEQIRESASASNACGDGMGDLARPATILRAGCKNGVRVLASSVLFQIKTGNNRQPSPGGFTALRGGAIPPRPPKGTRWDWRAKGTLNQVNQSIREPIQLVFEQLGDVEYPVRLAQEDPETFVQLEGSDWGRCAFGALLRVAPPPAAAPFVRLPPLSSRRALHLLGVGCRCGWKRSIFVGGTLRGPVHSEGGWAPPSRGFS